MKLNDKSREYRNELRKRDEEYEDYVRNGGCVALAFAAIFVITLMLVAIILVIIKS